MNLHIIRTSECIGRVVVFGDRDDVTFGTKETALFTSLVPIKVALTASGSQQAGGNRGFREHANERAVAAKSARTLMRDIAEIAKSLAERGEDIGANEAFRMPPNTSYARLASAALAFVDLVEPRKALFIERGLAATFVEDLEGMIATLSSAGETTGTSLSRQVGGTAGLEILANDGMKIVRELRSILRLKLRNTPGLLAEWESVARVHTNARKKATATAPGSGDGTGTGSTDGSSGSGGSVVITGS